MYPNVMYPNATLGTWFASGCSKLTSWRATARYEGRHQDSSPQRRALGRATERLLHGNPTTKTP